ncbi:MAG: hypothetical protein ACK5LC_14435 [Coprobacillaceae bacterium]
MADLLFKKKEQKPLFEAEQCIEWIDNSGKVVVTDICIYTKELMKAQDLLNNASYKEQIDYVKNTFFKLDFEVEEGQLLDQFIDVCNHLKKVLGKRYPR